MSEGLFIRHLKSIMRHAGRTLSSSENPDYFPDTSFLYCLTSITKKDGMVVCHAAITPEKEKGMGKAKAL